MISNHFEYTRAKSIDDALATRLRDDGFSTLSADIERHLDRALQEVHRREQRWTLVPELEAWREARAALMDDPDAPLPL